MPAFIYTEQIMIIVAKRTLKHMKETKLKRLIKKMMDCVFLDAMTPEFKAANAELLKAIKMNDKSGAVPHADLEAVNKAMKENDADKAGSALKKVQLQFSKAEKKLDDDVKSIQAKLETTKKAAETAKVSLKQKKALASVFDKLKALASGLSNNPKSASKLTALTDKVKDYGDLSKRASQIITLVSGNKDASKQIDMLKKSVDAAEKKFKKDLANVEKESKKADDALEVAKMQVKITHGKKDAFTKERLYIANVVKEIGGSLQADVPERKENITKEKLEKRQKYETALKGYIYKIGEAGMSARKKYEQNLSRMNKNHTLPGYRDEWFESLMYQASRGYAEAEGESADPDILKDINLVKTIGTNGEIYRAEAMMKSMADNNKVLKKVFVRPLNFIKKVKSDSDAIYNDNYFGFNMNTAKECSSKSALYSAAKIIANEPDVRSKVTNLLKQMDGVELGHFLRNLRSNHYRPYI